MPLKSDKQDALELAQAILGKAIGMDPDSVGPALLERVLAERRRQTKSPTWSAYQNLLRCRPDELDELVERIVVPETWFFRDLEPFVLLKEISAAARATGAFYSVLSAPCSTGEEPYSIAMALLESGFDPNKFHVDAADISRSSLQRAQQGVFGKNSFRGQAPFEAERYFEKNKEGRAVRAEVRRQVRFFQTNLVDPDGFPANQSYDAIFCRNFLIYLKPDVKTTTIKRLWRLLKPDGVLFVGHAESLPLLYEHFHSTNRPRAFAFLKNRDDATQLAAPAPRTADLTPGPVAAPLPRRTRPARAATRSEPIKRRREDSPPLRETSVSSPQTKEAAPNIAADDMEQARRLADEGRLDDARRLCEQRLKLGHPEADVYHLLGLVEEAAQRFAAAEEHFKKALYLEPGREETLVHLALLCERSGKAKQAAALRQRLKRLKERAAVESSG
jgi:chemotaxis protein methyltransferase WspC